MEKDWFAICKVSDWFKENDPFEENRQVDSLVCFNTGLISRLGIDTVNPEQVEDIGLKMQKEIDGENYKDVMSSKQKVKPLSHLMKTVKIKDKTLVLDSVKLFNRLVIVSQRELSVLRNHWSLN